MPSEARNEGSLQTPGSAWIPIERDLPPMDVPVWLYLPNIRQPVIGCRSAGGEGWLWCRSYDDYWFDGTWKTSTAEADGDEPSHWMPLPYPPNPAEWRKDEAVVELMKKTGWPNNDCAD